MIGNRIEQAGYPYIEGLHGIPFAGLPIGESRVASGSSRDIKCFISPLLITVADKGTRNFRLEASVDTGRILDLDLKTRVIHGRREKIHPDMFAARFVEFALVNFARLGQEIYCLRGTWLAGSINYATFTRVYVETGDAILAAQSTWTGQLAARHGFTDVAQATIGKTTVGQNLVTAYFEKSDILNGM